MLRAMMIPPLPLQNNGGYVHESFPRGSTFGTPREQRNVTNYHGNERQTDSRSLNVSLPRLPFDNSPLTPRKHKNCAYITNQKSYLKLKGIDIEDIYSVKRLKRDKPNAVQTSEYDHNIVNPVGSNMDLPFLVKSDNTGRRKKSQKEKADVWKPSDSRKRHGMFVNPLYRSWKELKAEIKIPGHVTPEVMSDRRLGKVLTQTRLQRLLSQEDPIIPHVFYTETNEVFTPRNSVNTSTL